MMIFLFDWQMDKASIIGDAILYVQGLQTKAKKLKVEIAEFESSSGIFQNAKKMNFTTYYPAIKRITKVCLVFTKNLLITYFTK